MQEQIGQFLRYLKDKKGYSDNTIVAYRNDLRQFVAFLQQTARSSANSWDKIDQSRILAYGEHLGEQPYAASTVARKIAATRASTGTPAQFVHPGEASHGDLGMITSNDAILALSNSGETPELSDIVAYSRRRSIPLVGITSRARSQLDLASDATLVLHDAGEACPMGLAPTTSTTNG